MNRIFRTLWSVAIQSWQAVPETAKTAGKKSASSASGVVASVALSFALTGGAGAQSPPAVNQLPTGGTVVRGTATINQTATAQAAAMTVNQTSQRAVVNWNTFNLGSAASVNFVQPNAQAVILNRVTDSNPSQIFGRITSNGQVFITNANGVYFSPTSSVDVGSITATTHSISNDNFMSGNYVFERKGATGKVVNEGRISAALGGYVALLAPEVQNTGVVVARAGTVVMAAGDIITLNIGGAGSLAGITTTPSAIATLIENKQAVQAPDGLIILSAMALNKLQAGVIKNSGSLEASSLVSKGGKIYLEGDDITLTSTSKIEAKGATGGGTVLVGGDWQGSGDMRQATKVTMEAGATIDASATDKGDGGKVVLWSDVHHEDSQTMVHGSIKAEAGLNGGDGGKIETSGHYLNVDEIQVSTQAYLGASGNWLLDPYDIRIDSSAAANTLLSGEVYTSTLTAPTIPLMTYSTVNVTALQNALANGNVEISTAGAVSNQEGRIAINSNVQWSSPYALKLTADKVIYGSGAITIGSAGGTLIFNQAGSLNTTSYWGTISGDGSIVKNGAGTLILTGANSYTGTTTINQGILQFGDGSATNTSLGSGNVIINCSSCTLATNVAANRTMTISSNISGTGTLSTYGYGTGSSAGVTVLSGNNTFTGNVLSSGGVMRVTSATALGASSPTNFVRLSATATLELGASGAPGLNFGSKSLTVRTGAKIRNASGDNFYDGVMTLEGDATITVDTSSSLNFAATGTPILIAANKRLTLNLADGNLTIAKGLTGGVGSSYLQTGSGQLASPTITNLTQLTGVYVRLNDPTGNDFSSTYGDIPDYTFSFFNSLTGSTKVNLAPTDYSLGSLTWTTTGTGTTAPTLTSNAGTYAMTYASGLTVSNTSYVLLGAGAATSWAITKAPLTVTASSASKTYGDANPTFTTTLSGFKNGQTLATSGVSGTGLATTSATTTTGAGTAVITAGVGNLAATNYDFSNLVDGTLTINKAHLTVSADSVSKTYGDANPTLSTTITGFVNGESLGTSGVTGTGSASTTAAVSTDVGIAPITAGVGNLAANNYDFTNLVDGSLTILPRAVQLTGQMNYSGFAMLDTTSSSTTLTATNLVGNDSLTFGGTATLAAADAGTQAMTGFSNLVLSNPNYTSTGASGSVTVLPTSAINVTTLNNTDVTALIGRQLAEMTSSGIGSLSSSQLQEFSEQQLAALSSSQFFCSNGVQIDSLCGVQPQGIRPAQVALLAPAQLAGLGADQLASFSPPQLQALSATQVNALAPAQLSALSAAQISLLTGNTAAPLSFPQVFALSPNQVSAIQPAQLSRMTAAEVGSFTDAQLQALTPAQIAAISPTSFGALGAEQIMAMSSAQLQSLSPEQLASFTPLQVASLNPAELNNFDATQLAAIGIFPKQASIDKFEAAIPVMTAVAPDVARMSGLEIRALTPELLNTLSSQQIASLKPAQLQALTTTQLSQLTPEQVDNLTPAQLAVMSPRQLQTLPTAPVTTADITPRKGVLAVTILQNATSKPVAAGIAFEQDADTISLKVTAAPAALPISEDVVFSQKLTTFLVAAPDGEMVEFQGSLVNNRMVIVAASDASKKIARKEMNLVLAAAVTSLGKDKRVMLANLEGVVLDLR